MRRIVVAVVALSACQLIDPPSSLTSARDGSVGDTIAPSACDASTETDPSNCGFCAHDCQGTTCGSGVCRTTTAFTASVSDMALEGNVIYFAGPQNPVADAGGVYTFDTQGSSTSPLVASPGAQLVAVHAPYVFWSTVDGAIHRALQDGSSEATLVTGQNVDCLAANGANVFWADGNAGTIFQFPAGDPPGSPQTFRQGKCVAANDKYVVYTDDVSMSRFDVAANHTDPFSPSIGQVDSQLSLGNDDAYFATMDGQTHYIFHVGPTTSTASPVTPIATYLQTDNNLALTTVVGDGRGVYWGINSGQAPIYGCSDPQCTNGQHQYAAVDYPWTIVIDTSATGVFGYAARGGQDTVERFAR